MKKNLVVLSVFILLAATLCAADKGASFIIKDASLWTLKGKTMVWKSSLSLGQELISVSKGTSKGLYENHEYDLVKVKTDTKNEGYVIESLVARNARGLAAVSTNLGTLYSAARDAAVTSTILPQMNVVAVWDVEGKPDFYEVKGYNLDNGYYIADKYMLTSDLSLNASDINVSILLQAIKAQKKKEQKQKTLQIISQKYSDSVFIGTAEELALALDPDSLPVADISEVFSTTTDVYIRDIPSIYGAIVKLAKEGTKVTAIKRTSASFTVGDKTAHWVKVSGPVQGWIFEAYLVSEGQSTQN
jgi:hypothetical protein